MVTTSSSSPTCSCIPFRPWWQCCKYPRGTRSGDEHDAFAVARWMADMAERGALAGYFAPPLTPAERAIAELEGWILGVR